MIAIPCCRWTHDDGAVRGAQSAQDGPQRLNNQQKQKVVGKNLNLVLLTTLVCVDNLTSRERGRKVGTGTIPSSPRMHNIYKTMPQTKSDHGFAGPR